MSMLIDQRYKRLRWQIIITTFLTYTVMYISRKAFAATAPLLMQDIGMTAIQFGMASSFYYILYGVAKFTSGFIADKVNPRVFLTPVMLLLAIVNFGIGLSGNVSVLLILYCLTAVLQGCGFPPIAKAINEWYSKSERGMWYSLWNTSHNVGGALAPIIASAVLVATGNWRWAFFVPAIITLVQTVLVAIFMRGKPELYGLPNVGEWKKDARQLSINKISKRGLTTSDIFKKYILSNPVIWLAIIGDLCIYVIRTVTNDWVSVYFVREMGWELVRANTLIAWFEVGGIVGGLTSGIISDRLFGANRWSTVLVYCVILMAGMGLVAVNLHSSYLLVASGFFIIGAGIYAPQMLFALGIIEATHTDAVGAATGLKGGVTYIGAALAGAPIAFIQSSYSWNGVIFLLVNTSLALLIITSFLVWFERRNKVLSG